jgi:hypothetical protein
MVELMYPVYSQQAKSRRVDFNQSCEEERPLKRLEVSLNLHIYVGVQTPM